MNCLSLHPAKRLNPFAMKTRLALALVLCSFVPATAEDGDEKNRLAELDAYWAEVSRAVGAGDFKGYAATCHDEGVLVSGSKKTSQPLSEALARWKPGIEKTQRGEMKASVEFRFSQRIGDKTTAHETGIFLYTSSEAGGEPKLEYIHFEALLVKRGKRWKILMEYQKSKASREEWEALKE